MPFYRIKIPLDRFEGAKSGRVISCTAGSLIEAPEGEFKALSTPAEYSREEFPSPPLDDDTQEEQ